MNPEILDINRTLQVSTSGAIIVPVGENPVGGSQYELQGAVRYNTQKSSFEGYNGSVWAGLGGVIKLDDATGVIIGTAKAFSSDAEPLYANTGLYLSAGDIWFDTSEEVIKYFDGATWVTFGAAYL